MIFAVPWLALILLHILISVAQTAFMDIPCTAGGNLPGWTCGSPFETIASIFVNSNRAPVIDLIRSPGDMLDAAWQAFIVNYAVLRLEGELLSLFGWGIRLFVMAIGAVALATAGLSLLGLFRSFLPV